MTYTVYALFDERAPDVVRYVGFSRNPEHRLTQHLKAAQGRYEKSHRINWLRQVRAAGARVLWRTLVIADTADEAAALEIACIRDLLAMGHPLVNGTEGGEGVQGFGGNLAPEALARRTAAMQTADYLAQRSLASSRYWATGETRVQQAAKMRTFWATAEGLALKQKVAETNRLSQTGTTRSDEARAKMAAAKLGKPHARQRTAEWNAKISAAQKGVMRGPKTPEQRAAHLAAMQNPETRAKMSAAARARRQKKD